MSSQDRGVKYAVFVGKRNISESQLPHPSGDDDVRIAPILNGAKSGGLFQTILGAALVVVGALTSWSGGTALMLMGASMMLGGVAQMISAHQSTQGSQAGNSLQSYNFNGAQNTAYQGGPVPLLYGHMRVGSTVISEGLLAQDGTAQLVGGHYVAN